MRRPAAPSGPERDKVTSYDATKIPFTLAGPGNVFLSRWILHCKMIPCRRLASLPLLIASSSEPDKLPIKFNYSPNGAHLDLTFPRVHCIPPRSLRREDNKSGGRKPPFHEACGRRRRRQQRLGGVRGVPARTFLSASPPQRSNERLSRTL